MQLRLYQALGLGGLLSLLAGSSFGRPEWGYAAALGCLASGIYFWFLGRQVTRTLVLDGRPALGQVIVSMLVRQAVSGLALLVCLRLWGAAWWACLGAILVARHWVMVVATPPRTA